MSEELNKIETLLDEYVDAAGDSFILAEPLAAIQSKTARSDEGLRKDLSSLLDRHDRVFQVNDGETRYLPRAEFFRGAKFRVVPTEFEIERGALVPGHRFVPFADDSVFPSYFELFAPEAASPIEVTKLSCPLKNVASLHALLGAEEIVDHFIADDPENARILSAESGVETVRISVFDMDEFYAETNFSPGEALVFTVEDWRRGVFRFDLAPEEGVNDVLSPEEWIRRFEDALGAVIDERGEYITIPEQLSRAMFRAGPEVLEQPVLALEEFQQASEIIEIRLLGDQSVLCRIDDATAAADGDAPLPSPDEATISSGDTNSLDAILDQMGAGLKSIELRAFMRDEFFNGGDRVDDVLERVIGKQWLVFADDAQEAVFRNFIEEVWEDEVDAYNRFADEDKGPIRGRILEVIDARLQWLRYLREENVSNSSKLRGVMAPLVNCAFTLSGLLVKLDERDRDLTEEEVDAALNVVDRVEATQRGLIDEFNVNFIR